MQLYFGELVHKGRFKYYCAAASIVMPALRSLQPRQASPRSAALTALSPNLTMMLLSLSRKIHCTTLTNRFSLNNNPLTQKSELCSRLI